MMDHAFHGHRGAPVVVSKEVCLGIGQRRLEPRVVFDGHREGVTGLTKLTESEVNLSMGPCITTRHRNTRGPFGVVCEERLDLSSTRRRCGWQGGVSNGHARR